jgi:hypothetical protein
MHQSFAVVAALALLPCAAPAFSGEELPPRAIVSKAIEAHGGKESLDKFKAMTFSGKGTFYGLGQGVPFSADWKIQMPKQIRFDMNMDFMGQRIQFMEVVGKEKGWQKINDEVKDLSREEVAEKHAQLYADQLTQLTPLLHPDIKLSTIGEVKVGDQESVGIKASQKGQRDVNLYFDKKTLLLVKADYEVKEAVGVAQNQEVFYSKYQKVNGVSQPMKIAIHRDGKLFVDTEISNLQLLEKLDDSAFDRP